MDTDRPGRVPPTLDRIAGWSWRLLVIGAAILATALVLSRLRIVLLPLLVALMITTVLVPPARWLRRRRFPPLVAAWTVVLGFIAVVVLIGTLIVQPLIDQFADLGPTLEDAADEVEEWFVEGPLDLDPDEVDENRERLADAVEDSLSSEGRILDGAIIAGEIIAGTLLALVTAFFFVKDGERLLRRGSGLLPVEHRDRADRIAGAAWSTLGRYLLGAATLGLFEGVVIGVTLFVVGSDVVLPVAVLTVVAAFFPFVGAILAGIVATLVALVSAGPGAAAVVAVVAVVVQQLDNDLLAPVIYGRALSMHPLAVILAVATGAALGGLLGAFLAVPLTAIAVNAVAVDKAR